MPIGSLSSSKIATISGGDWEIEIFPTVTSTQDVAQDIASSRPVRRLAVVADHQQQGRGQSGRTWNAPAGRCLLMSALIRLELPNESVRVLPALSPLAAADGIADSVGASVGLTWPNDLMFADKKVGGVLTETSWAGDKFENAVIGIGINVNVPGDEVSELAPNATSLLRELGRPVDRADLAGHILMQLGRKIGDLQDRSRAAGEIFERWKLSLGLEGRTVRVSAGQYLGATGRVKAIDGSGTLVVDAGGTRLELMAGYSSVEIID